MLPIVQIGPLTLRTSGLALLAGFWIGLEVASRFGRRRGISDDSIYNIGFWSLFGAILAARLAYVITNLPVYLEITPIPRALLAVVTPVPGNENALAGIVVAVVVFTDFSRRQNIDLLTLLDAFTPAIALMAVAIGLSNLFGGDLYGVETSLPWAIDLWGAMRHPTQAYLTLAGAIILIGLVVYELQREQRLRAGALFQITIISLGLSLLFIEAFRADSPVILENVRLWQVIGLSCSLLALAGFIWRVPLPGTARES